MEEIDIKKCLKKINKEYQKNIIKQKNQHKKFLSCFTLHVIKIEQKALIFEKQCINKNAFHKNKIPKVEIKKIMLSKKRLIW